MSFSTIRFYIILKQKAPIQQSRAGFSTIRFYIILKPQGKIDAVEIVSVPYVFTSFSNIRNHLTDKNLFQYHTFLHHSQTSTARERWRRNEFQYHTFLHHSQTCINAVRYGEAFQYHTFLHHSQTTFRIWQA